MNSILVLLNPAAGTLAASDSDEEVRRIRDGFRAAGVAAEVVAASTPELIERARSGVKGHHDAVIAGGGDGTLNAIANEVADSPAAFGVLPLGTMNHFAKELNVPLEMEAAVKALANGRVEELPVGEVNGKIFLNFSSMGLHPAVIADRDAQREEKGRNKWLAMLLALARKLADPPLLRVALTAENRTSVRLTPSVIVCNNPYQMKVFGVEEASVPDRNLLNVYIAREVRPSGLLRLIIRAVFGQLEQAKNFEVLALREFTIGTRRRHRVSLDGELLDLHPPLHYRIRPRPMKVLIPAPQTSS